MKTKLSSFFLLLSFIFSMGLVSCKKNKQDDKTKEEIQSNIQSGSWKISYFEDSGDDHTMNFANYNFVFGSSSVTASNGATTISGTWSITDSNSNDDSPGDLHFNLFFSGNANFEELNDDWEIVSQSSTKIELRDISGGNGGTDLLTFTKN